MDGFVSLQYQENPYLQGRNIYFYHILLSPAHDVSASCVIGYCYLNLHPQLAEEVGMIGYFIEEAYRGHSYAFRAALLLLEIARQKGQSYVTISCEVGNAASLHICRRLQEVCGAGETVFTGERWVFGVRL